MEKNILTAIAESKRQTNHFTNTVCDFILAEEGGLFEEIDNIMNQTKEESKQLYLLAEFIRSDYVDLSLSELRDIKNRVIETFVTSIIFNIDCFEVAKQLMNNHKQNLKLKKSA